MTQSTQLRVLLVDDEDSFRLSIEMGLKMSNEFAVQSSDSGESAVELLGKESFDVILLDHKMGEMSGLDVLEWMHAHNILTPVIMVTAAGSESIAVEAMKLGVYDYLRKDQIDIDRLSLAVKSVYERYLYRKQLIEREAGDRLLMEKQQELDSLRTFHTTVNSIGQLVERSLADLAASVKRSEEGLLKVVGEGNRSQCEAIFREVKQGIEVVTSGVNSMRNLSTMVTRKLEDIHIVPQQQQK